MLYPSVWRQYSFNTDFIYIPTIYRVCSSAIPIPLMWRVIRFSSFTTVCLCQVVVCKKSSDIGVFCSRLWYKLFSLLWWRTIVFSFLLLVYFHLFIYIGKLRKLRSSWQVSGNMQCSWSCGIRPAYDTHGVLSDEYCAIFSNKEFYHHAITLEAKL